MPDSMFMNRIRGKLAPGSTEGGDSDVGAEGLAKDIAGEPSAEDYAVSVPSPMGRPVPARNLKGG